MTKEEIAKLGDEYEVCQCMAISLGEIKEAIKSGATTVKEMITYYKPTKINIASFANMLARVHIHIMARFENDDYYPEPMWGKKQRVSQLTLRDEEEFYKRVFYRLNKELG